MARFASRKVRWLAVLLAVGSSAGMVWAGRDAVGEAAGEEVPVGQVEAQDPRVWAGVSADVPNASTNAMFSVVELNRLMIGVGLVNDGTEPLPMDLVGSRLLINGTPVPIFEAQGPAWEKLDPGRSYAASRGGLGRHFARPGLYKIQWIGKGFASTVLELRVVEH